MLTECCQVCCVRINIGGVRMKIEYKKQEKELYQPKAFPQKIIVGKQKYFCIKGKGNPNRAEFIERVGILYSLSYTLRMMPKNGYTPEGYNEYTVYPLEGLWDLSEAGRATEQLDKDELLYTIMIRQPDFVNEETIQKVFEMTNQKKPHPLLAEAYYEEIEDGPSVQMMHIGSYDDEVLSFKKMKEFIEETHEEIKTLVHREIFMSKPNNEHPEKMKTILRYRIK